ncbi:hypothetical protein [Luteibacter sp. HA06]
MELNIRHTGQQLALVRANWIDLVAAAGNDERWDPHRRQLTADVFAVSLALSIGCARVRLSSRRNGLTARHHTMGQEIGNVFAGQSGGRIRERSRRLGQTEGRSLLACLGSVAAREALFAHAEQDGVEPSAGCRKDVRVRVGPIRIDG